MAILDRPYKLVVLSLTYNHVKYIEKSLNGFVSQVTEFPFLVIVIDDCSTDGTQTIIKQFETQYPHLIKGIYHSINHFSKGEDLFKEIREERYLPQYVAFCEGDDYWINPHKLHLQVQYLDSHPSCSLCFHSMVDHWEDGRAEDGLFYDIQNRNYSGTELFRNWIISTASVVFRSSILDADCIRILSNKNFIFYDIVLFLLCASKGDVYGMRDVMGVYRRLDSGYTMTLNSELKTSYDKIWKYCVHNREMARVFGPILGTDFETEAQHRAVEVAYNGFLLSIQNLNLTRAIFFFYKSIVYLPKSTLSFYRSRFNAKAIIVFVFDKFFSINLLSWKKRLFSASR